MLNILLAIVVQAAAPSATQAPDRDLSGLTDQELSCEMLRLERLEVLDDRTSALATQQEIAASQADWARNAEPTALGLMVERLGEKIIARAGEQAARSSEIAVTLEGARRAFCSRD